MNHARNNSSIRYILYFLHFILGINACVGGLLLILAPDGSMLEMQADLLKHSPFSNYIIPGFVLFTFIGLTSALSLSGLVFTFHSQGAEKLNMYGDKHWAWAWSLYTGIGTIVWITVQLLFVGYFWLQPMIILIAVAILVCTLAPGVMRYYDKDNIQSK